MIQEVHTHTYMYALTSTLISFHIHLYLHMHLHLHTSTCVHTYTDTMGLLPWLLTHSLSYAVRVPLAVQTRVICHHPFLSETHTCIRSLRWTGLLLLIGTCTIWENYIPCVSTSLKMPWMSFFPGLCPILDPKHFHLLKTPSSGRSTPGKSITPCGKCILLQPDISSPSNLPLP